MTTPLHLAFEDGFAADTVLVEVEGKEVARQSGLTSSLATALAATAEAALPVSAGLVTVSVPGRGLSASQKLDFLAQPYLAVAIRDGRLVLRPQDEPFVYF
jgi:hypothetical protein